MRTTLLEKLENKILIDDGCWEWIGAKTGDGYGRVNIDKVGLLAHRVIYELLVGPIPAGLQCDHLCRNRECVRPDHIELVTNQENISRGLTGQYNKVKTQCPAGHLYDKKNTYLDKQNRRYCRACGLQRYHDRKSRGSR